VLEQLPHQAYVASRKKIANSVECLEVNSICRKLCPVARHEFRDDIAADVCEIRQPFEQSSTNAKVAAAYVHQSQRPAQLNGMVKQQINHSIHVKLVRLSVPANSREVRQCAILSPNAAVVNPLKGAAAAFMLIRWFTAAPILYGRSKAFRLELPSAELIKGVLHTARPHINETFCSVSRVAAGESQRIETT
jgi:hypothetical protein